MPNVNNMGPINFPEYVDEIAKAHYIKVDKKSGALVKTNWLSYYFEKFKGFFSFFGCCDWTNKHIVQLQALGMIQQNQQANIQSLTALAVKTGLIPPPKEQPRDIIELTKQLFNAINPVTRVTVLSQEQLNLPLRTHYWIKNFTHLTQFQDFNWRVSSLFQETIKPVVAPPPSRPVETARTQPAVTPPPSSPVETARPLAIRVTAVSPPARNLNDLLTTACREGNVDEARRLIEQGGDVNHVPVGGIPLIVSACMKGQIGIAELLIESGVDVHQVVQAGHSLLTIALLSDHVGMVRLLLRRGVKVLKINQEKEDAYHHLVMLRKKSCKEIYKMFVQHLPKEVIADSKKSVRRRLIGHVIGIETLSAPFRDKSIAEPSLTGGRSPYFASQIAKSWKAMFNFLPESRPQNFQLIADAFDSASQEMSPEASFQAWQQDKPVIVSTGHSAHHVGVLFWKDFMVFCDREGSFDPPQNCRFFKFDQSKLNVQALDHLGNMTEGTKENYLRAMKEFPARLGAVPILEHAQLFANQTVGNCVFANQEGLLLALSILSEREAHPDAPVQDIVKQEKGNFINWKAYQQIVVIQKHLDRIDLSSEEVNYDLGLIAESLLKSLPLPKNADEDVDPKIKEAWQAAEEGFLKITPDHIKSKYLEQKEQRIAALATMQAAYQVMHKYGLVRKELTIMHEGEVYTLVKACKVQKLDVLKKLLEQGGDPNDKDEDGFSLLDTAFLLDDLGQIELLLKYQVNPDQICRMGGITLLDKACSEGSLEIARLLLAYGAKPNQTDKQGVSLLDRAIQNNQSDVVELLQQYGATGGS